VHDPQAIYAFEDSVVAIPIAVLEELDKFKSESSQKGFNSREVIRALDLLRGKGSLNQGVLLDNGAHLQIEQPVPVLLSNPYKAPLG